MITCSTEFITPYEANANQNRRARKVHNVQMLITYQHFFYIYADYVVERQANHSTKGPHESFFSL